MATAFPAICHRFWSTWSRTHRNDLRSSWLRLFVVYVGMLYQQLIRSNQLTDARRLPPVLPIVLYNGEARSTASRDVSQLVESVPGGLEHYRPRMSYLLLEERGYEETELAAMQNLVAALFRLEKSLTPVDVCRVVDALGVWLRQPEQAELGRSFADWLGAVLLPRRMPGVSVPELENLQEVRTLLAERVKEKPNTQSVEYRMASQLIPPPELAPPSVKHLPVEARVQLWEELVDENQTLLLAGLRAKVGPNGDLQAAYRQWNLRQQEDHDDRQRALLENLSCREAQHGE